MPLDCGQEGKTFWTDGTKHNPDLTYSSFLCVCNYDFLLESPDVCTLSHSAFTYRPTSSQVINKASMCVCACACIFSLLSVMYFNVCSNQWICCIVITSWFITITPKIFLIFTFFSSKFLLLHRPEADVSCSILISSGILGLS